MTATRVQIVEAALKEDPNFWNTLFNCPSWIYMDVSSKLGTITLNKEEAETMIAVLRVKGLTPQRPPLYDGKL